MIPDYRKITMHKIMGNYYDLAKVLFVINGQNDCDYILDYLIKKKITEARLFHYLHENGWDVFSLINKIRKKISNH